jgi:hypothetical protein
MLQVDTFALVRHGGTMFAGGHVTVYRQLTTLLLLYIDSKGVDFAINICTQHFDQEATIVLPKLQVPLPPVLCPTFHLRLKLSPLKDLLNFILVFLTVLNLKSKSLML